jgi:hypothetical protein
MNITLTQTGAGCPEQYDAKDDTGNLVGYLHLRRGHFHVEAFDPDGTPHTVYSAEPSGDGVFEDYERDEYLAAAVRCIRAYVDPSLAAAREALRDRMRAAILKASWSNWDVGDGEVVEMGLDGLVATIQGVLDSDPADQDPPHILHFSDPKENWR